MEADEIKKKKLREMQRKQEAEEKEEQQLDLIVKGLLEEEARQRLSNVRLVNNDLYLKAVQYLVYASKSGQIQEKINENQMKIVLEKLNEKREIKIQRK